MVYYSNHPSQYKNRKSFAQSNYSHSSIQDYYYSLKFAIQYRLVLLVNDTAAVFIVYSKLAIKPQTFLLHLILNTTYLVFTFHPLFTSNPNLSSNPISRLQVFTIALTQWVMEVQRNGAISKLHKGRQFGHGRGDSKNLKKTTRAILNYSTGNNTCLYLQFESFSQK